MKIEPTNFENWTPKDFANYAKLKLAERGIEYKLQAPFDFIMMGRLIKDHKRKGGTGFLIKQKIDEVFKSFDLTKVTSLQFLYSLAKPEKEEKSKPTKLKNDEIYISDELKQKLLGLRDE